MQISAGDKLGPYEILASIGHGGMVFERSVRPQGAQNLFRWDVTADGKRFLLDRVGPQNTSTPITLVLNWQAGLKK